ncbi:YVTN family beta-propeller repeat protein [Syntrophus gentianae]|nr:cytochrome D1 domain-containing protein [Syntrophus gentianae]
MKRFFTLTRMAIPGLFLLTLSSCAKLDNVSTDKTAPLTPLVYVANENSNSVTVIDASTFKVIATIDSEKISPHDLQPSRDGTRLYATDTASGRLSVIDTQSRKMIASIYTGIGCRAVALTHDDQFAWVTNTGDDTISIVETRNYRIVGTLAVRKGPAGLTFSQDGRFAYVSNQGNKTVAVVDTASYRVIKTIPVGTNPQFLILGPDGRIWGTNSGSNDLYVIDPATQTKVATFKVGPNPQQIAFAYKGPVGPNAYVTVSGANHVAVVSTDKSRMQVMEHISVGNKPNGISANREGNRIYVGNEGSNDLDIVDTATSARIAKIPVGQKPVRVVMSRD